MADNQYEAFIEVVLAGYPEGQRRRYRRALRAMRAAVEPMLLDVLREPEAKPVPARASRKPPHGREKPYLAKSGIALVLLKRQEKYEGKNAFRRLYYFDTSKGRAYSDGPMAIITSDTRTFVPPEPYTEKTEGTALLDGMFLTAEEQRKVKVPWDRFAEWAGTIPPGATKDDLTKLEFRSERIVRVDKARFNADLISPLLPYLPEHGDVTVSVPESALDAVLFEGEGWSLIQMPVREDGLNSIAYLSDLEDLLDSEAIYSRNEKRHARIQARRGEQKSQSEEIRKKFEPEHAPESMGQAKPGLALFLLREQETRVGKGHEYRLFYSDSGRGRHYSNGPIAISTPETRSFMPPEPYTDIGAANGVTFFDKVYADAATSPWVTKVTIPWSRFAEWAGTVPKLETKQMLHELEVIYRFARIGNSMVDAGVLSALFPYLPSHSEVTAYWYADEPSRPILFEGEGWSVVQASSNLPTDITLSTFEDLSDPEAVFTRNQKRHARVQALKRGKSAPSDPESASSD